MESRGQLLIRVDAPDSGQRGGGGSDCALQARRTMTREGVTTALHAPGALSAVLAAPLAPPEAARVRAILVKVRSTGVGYSGTDEATRQRTTTQ